MATRWLSKGLKGREGIGGGGRGRGGRQASRMEVNGHSNRMTAAVMSGEVPLHMEN